MKIPAFMRAIHPHPTPVLRFSALKKNTFLDFFSNLELSFTSEKLVYALSWIFGQNLFWKCLNPIKASLVFFDHGAITSSLSSTNAAATLFSQWKKERKEENIFWSIKGCATFARKTHFHKWIRRLSSEVGPVQLIK